MLNWFAILTFVAILWPLAAVWAWVAPAVCEFLQRRAPGLALATVALWLLGGVFLFSLSHDDVFTGLDEAAYRSLAHGFGNNYGLVAQDTVLARVPPELRQAFLYSPGVRPTRNRTHQVTDPQSLTLRPYFNPLLPLAAAGGQPLLSPDWFVPLLTFLWLGLVLTIAASLGGWWGLAAGTALLLGTAWPAWFGRGFFAETPAAILTAALLAGNLLRPLRGAMLPTAGFALGLAVSLHPTLIFVSAPVALGLLAGQKRARDGLLLLAGGLLGLLPIWLLTRWVCSPYGNWTRWATLRHMLAVLPEHRAVFLALLLGLAGLAVAVSGLCHARLRRRIARLLLSIPPRVWLLVALLPPLTMLLLPGPVGATLRCGALAFWTGVRIPYALLLLLAGWATLWTNRRPSRAIWLAGLCWAALFAAFLKGVETPVGIWSQRRLVPVWLPLVTLLAICLADARRYFVAKSWRTAAALLLLAAGGLANLIRWPVPYLIPNEKGASRWVTATAGLLPAEGWVIFDYFPHAVPYMNRLDNCVLGLDEKSHDRWPAVMDWLGTLVGTQEVWLATSWSPCRLEEAVRLEEVAVRAGNFPLVRAKEFFPARGSMRKVSNVFQRLVPLAAGEALVQEKIFDGSPLGLRGQWGPLRPLMAAGPPAAWSRQNCGIVGPLPQPGETVEILLEAAAGRKTPQTIRLLPPWAGAELTLEVPTAAGVVGGFLQRPPAVAVGEASATGIYRLQAATPYDPATDGLGGYPDDLGVLVRRIVIRVVQDKVEEQ